MKSSIHQDIFCFIDKKIDLSPTRFCRKHGCYYSVSFANENILSPGGRFVSKEEIAKFEPNEIIIHRSDISKPNTSFIDEVVSLLHEYGHFVSLRNGNDHISEAGFNYDLSKNLQKFACLKDEYSAWKYAICTIHKLPITLCDILCLYIMVILEACKRLNEYAAYTEGIIG